ncbi:EndoU domain-containing protein [Bacillus sp. LR_5]|uniref:EndoU domain-containing protein n=1 Tax=Bacillus sp. LR_5 TaxID=3055784 RepID=UPI00366FDC04
MISQLAREDFNGVRVGNVPGHKVKAKRSGSNQSWFPESWTESELQMRVQRLLNYPNLLMQKMV